MPKRIIRKLKKCKVYSSFKDNILGTDLADMQLITKYNKEFQFLLCAIDIFSKYALVVLLKDRNYNYWSISKSIKSIKTQTKQNMGELR